MNDGSRHAPGPGVLRDRAPAKVNLTLHVLGRRSDGYHDLLSLVAFAGRGDALALNVGKGLSIALDGPTAEAAGPDDDNLVLKAARQLAGLVPGLVAGHFTLTKRLPVAAGLGGGSSDAAAALRLLARANGLPADDPRLLEAARRTGSDVPVCLHPRACVMSGTGHEVGPPADLPPQFALLVNPRVAVPTPVVFRGLGLASATPGPSSGFVAPVDPAAWLLAGRNDLEPPAISVAPEVAVVLDALRDQPDCRIARMSGSGATCFGLFSDCTAAARAARALRSAHAGWWVAPTVLR